MICILTNTDVILKAEVRPQLPNQSDAMVTAILSLKLKQNLSESTFQDQQSYLSASSKAAYLALNKLDQAKKYRASLNLISLNNKKFHLLEGSTSSGLGYTLALFYSWWSVVLKNNGEIKCPIFTTGEITNSGKIKKIGCIREKIDSLCKYLDTDENRASIFYFCFPKENEIDSIRKKKLIDRGGVLIGEDYIQKMLFSLLGDDYDGASLGRWRPFKSDAPFEYEDSLRFFGRSNEIDNIIKLLNSHGFTLLSAASGSGKTSIIKAGVIPVFEKDKTLFWHYTTPSKLGNSSNSIYSLVEQLFESWSLYNQHIDLPKLQEQIGVSIFQGLGELNSLLETKDSNYLLVFDQAEEIFLKSKEISNKNIKLLNFLVELSNQLESVNIIFSIRSEYLDWLFGLEILKNPCQFNLTKKISQSDWKEIIYDQATFSGVGFEVDDENNLSLDKRIIDDASHTPNSLAIVENMLDALYLRSEKDSEDQSIIKFKHYNFIGGLKGFIAQEASQLLKTQNDIRKLNYFFDIFFSQDQDYLLYAKDVEIDDLYKNNQDIIDLAYKFFNKSLIVNSIGSIIKFPHDCLLEGWPELKAWSNRSDNYLRWRYKIERDFLDWNSESCRNPNKNIIEIINTQAELVLNNSQLYQDNLEKINQQKHGDNFTDYSRNNSPFISFMKGWNNRFEDIDAKEYLMVNITDIWAGRYFMRKGFVGDYRLKDYINKSLSNSIRNYLARALFVIIIYLLFI